MTPILNISEGLLKGDVLNGELRNDAEKKELCVKYVFHMINKGHINTALMRKTSFEYYFEQCNLSYAIIFWFPYSTFVKEI